MSGNGRHLSARELVVVLEAQMLVDAGEACWDNAPLSPGPTGFWECPCGNDPPKPGSTTTPVQTRISLREPRCFKCQRKHRKEYERASR